MNSRRLILLTLAALVVLAGSLWIAQRDTDTSSQAALLYPALKGELNAVTAVRIFKAGDAPAIELQRKDDAWTIAQRFDYPADKGKVHELLRSLAEAKLLEEKTSKPDNYAKLGVEDVSAATANGVRVELAGTTQPVNLIVGKHAPGAQSGYVRRVGETQSWLIDAAPQTSASVDTWLQKQIIDISADRVQSAEIATGAATPHIASKASRADANFVIEKLPQGKELNSPSAANGFATALTSVTLADVHPAAEFAATAPAARATYRTFDGLVAEVSGWQREDQRFIAVSTSFDASLAERFKVAAAPAEAQAAAAPGATPAPGVDSAKVQDEAKTLNARVSGWVYEVPSYKYEAIFKGLEELLKN